MAILAVAWLVHRSVTPLEPGEAHVEAAIAEITGESTAVRTEPRPVQPPGFQPRAGPPVNPGAGGAQAPPGYSIVGFDGEMARAPMPPQDVPAEPDGAVVAEHPWLAAPGAIDALVRQSDAANRDWTFGWVGVAPGTDGDAFAQQLQALGGRVLGRSADLLRARLPGDAERLERIARLPGVVGVAATPLELKMPPSLATEALSRPPWERVPVLVTLMDGDPDGVWRRALADLGGVVGVFDPAIRVYPVVLAYAQVNAVAAADFVLAVEPVRRIAPANDSAVPVMGADALRLHDGEGFSGIGGASVPIGVMDTGLNIHHEAIGEGRRSICGSNFAADVFTPEREQDQDLWIDAGEHGTHVTGTLAGNGAGAPQFAGMAPLVRDIRVAKVLSAFGSGSLTGMLRGMDFLARPSRCGAPGAPAAKPELVSVSLGEDGFEWAGVSAGERKLDSVVWTHRQLYVVAQANSSFVQYSDFASAKNSLAVGAVDDGGDLATFSSFGPTADGRLKPQVVGAGVNVYSAAGDGSHSAYQAFSGTSMATPAVAGVAALLMDAVPALRGQPAAVRARLMAGAIRPDAFLADAARFPAHNTNGPGSLQHRYGLGKVSARTSVLERDTPDGWAGGGAIVEVGAAEYGFRDIAVPVGASRLDIVLTWDERPADTLTGSVLNDLDLWVDRGADCPLFRAACGEGASLSSGDNVEWLILRDPPPGVYRLKVVPKRVRVDAPRAALAWAVIRGPSTPQLAIAADAGPVRTNPGEPFSISATLSVDGYVASGTVLRVDCRGAADSPACGRVEYVAVRASEASREDRVKRTLQGESGDGIALGELAAGEEQTVELLFHGVPDADRFRLYLTATAWNAASASTSVEVRVGQSNIADPPIAQVPANDRFVHAAPLRGAAGSRDFDLLLATPEPGEPPFAQTLVDDTGEFQSTERPRSVWYRFTAPATDTYRFAVAKAAENDIADDVQLDLFETPARRGPLHPRGAQRLSPVHVGAMTGGGLTFAARRNQAYTVRLGIVRERLFDYPDEPAELEFLPFEDPAPIRRRSLLPLSIHWQPARRPANDDLELAEALTGATGRVERNNQSATQQPGERLQPLAATAWFRWTAPPGSGGDWRFSVDRRYLHVAAFTGGSVQDLRLVSGFPERTAAFPVAGGEEYLIVVASTGASVSGSDYALSWAPGERTVSSVNDDMKEAEPMPGEPSFVHETSVNLTGTTVQPGEPEESGTRTAWWSWTAPVDGAYAWRIDSPDLVDVQAAVFAAGDPPAALAASRTDRTALSLSFQARASKRYLFSVGLPVEAALLDVADGKLRFEWGPAPHNDNLATANPLAGAAGSVFGDARFATLEPGEDAALLGDASLWWTWNPPSGGWYRFELDEGAPGGIVAVYRVLDGVVEDAPLAVSRWLRDRSTLVFSAESGVRYAVRVGTSGALPPGGFTLSWTENGPPAWLRHAGALKNGYVDGGGNLTQLVTPGSIAFNADGSELYVATALGLQAYARDAEDGALAHRQTMAGADPGVRLFWDGLTGSLIAASCTGWRRYARSETGEGLAPAVPIEGATPCPEGVLLRGPDGSDLYLAAPHGIATLRLNKVRTALTEVDHETLPGIAAAAIAPAADYVYASTADGLHVLARDSGTGALKFVRTLAVDEGEDDASVGDGQFIVNPDPGFDDAGVGLLNVDPAGQYLLAVTATREMLAFDLTDPAAPRPLIRDRPIGRRHPADGVPCTFASMRGEVLTLDVFCTDAAHSVRLLPDIPALRTEDTLNAGGRDAFGDDVPPFSLQPGASASPDGRHVYATARDGILIFERIGSR